MINTYQVIDTGKKKIDTDINNKQEKQEPASFHTQHSMVPTVAVEDAQALFYNIRFTVTVDKPATSTVAVGAKTCVFL
jgi:hypothetical protein